MGAVFCFWGERGLPHDPPLFIYFILSPACWVKRELRLREPWLGDEGLFNHTHTYEHTHMHTQGLQCAPLKQETLLTP